ncbi:LOW QUALITY PROTEIN: protocadherin Fat 1-like [Ruditapes philippinarum]|uniref:LOW QUALITY PROTEIN: protocadherin Fat 1-like n=1 Tax=Ruditapes philippinarum TaxID=129788 RepID=UPI00295A9D60|nr:LOW QUALITY PROTEIN: protocadherin Fat 1-like [Ruditapes philippinarum]
MLPKSSTGVLLPRTTWTKWLIWLTTFSIATVAVSTEDSFSLTSLHFTQDQYNVTIPENSLGKTFVTPASKMGIYVPENIPVKISYQILNSEEDLFKVEDHLVGNFNFLLIRTHSGSYGRINRELTSEYRLQIKAIAQSKGVSYETTTNIIVYVSDVNDLQPLFDLDFYNVSVREDTLLHTSIARVSAYDGDEGINAQIYYSFVQRTNVFAIHPTSGVISLTRPLDFHLQKVYNIDMLAQDRGPVPAKPYRKRPTTLQIHVLEVNYFPPDISIKKLPNLFEPGQEEIILAIVNVKDKDKGNNGKIGAVEIVKGSLDGAISLQKGEQDGEYRVILKPSQKTSVPTPGFNVTLKAEDKGQPSLSANETFYVSVFDTRTIPKFSKSIYNVTVEEIAPINTPVTFVTSELSTSNFDVRYEIVSGNNDNLFKINQISGLVSTSAQINAEKVTNVKLKIIAYDAVNTHHANSDSCIVNISVIDNNDNAPEFDITDNVSEIYIQENLPVGSSIFKISAIDRDKKENGKISFSITNSRHVPFEIEPFTGVLKTTELLDYETMRLTYKLNIRVSDWGTPYPRENEMIFTINLQDVNDNTPQFEKKDCSGYISRDAPINTEIIIVAAIDFDVNDIIQYRIIGGNGDNCFALHRESARVFLNCSLREMPDEKRYLRIVAHDGIHESSPVDVEMTLVNSKQSSQLSNSLANIQCQKTDIFQKLQDLVIRSREANSQTNHGFPESTKVEPVNNPPEFNDTIPTNLEVSEGLAVGTVLAKVEAIDVDRGYNGKLVYVIKSGDIAGHFKIDMYTGKLTIMSKLDREIRDEYNLLIEVSDLGQPSLSSNISISVKVLDENDNAPKFEQEVYSATISENINRNATVTQVSATDQDLGKNAKITYTIVSDTDHFAVNPRNGMIVVNKPLDRERHPVYTVLVRASDKGEDQISLSSTATVLVELTDINDVVPEFTPDIYSVRIREDLPIGAVVTVVTAADTDEGKNGEVQYQLVYGENFFEIDSSTGVIRIIKRLDYETQQVHNISVRAQDGGVPSLISVCFINIEVVDVNENLLAPVFENFFAYGYVSENEPVGTTVMFVKAYDPDGDGVTYSIRDGSGLGRFTIDSNGTICTSQVLDRETATHYWLTVYAQDHGLVPLHTRHEVYIEVKDTNDHIPMTFDPVYYGTVPENVNEKGLFVTQVQAYDLDKNLNQTLTYEITRYDPLNFFKIDKYTGVITTTGKPLDREQQSKHKLEVTVSDNGEPALTYQTRVFIKVEDDNDNRPKFNKRLYRIQTPATEFMGLDIPVFQVLAWDDDEGENGELTFDIRNSKDDSKIFMVHPKTGMIYATDSLEYGDVHHFVVRASDNGKPKPRKTTVKVRIEVVERMKKSPNVPRFTTTSMMKRVMEDDKVGHLVDLLQAHDRDNNDQLFYSIIDGDPHNQFYIGLDTGALVVARALDWEVKSFYNLTIQVTDGVNFDNCSVHIEVIDINDNVPLFENTHYESSFPESTPVGTTLLKVTATDADNNMLIYLLPDCCNSASTRELFDVNAETGEVVVKSALDHEVAMQHNLTIMVSDQGMSPNRNFTRVTLNILDHNDHQPVFLSDTFHGRVFETAAIGTSVVQVMAVDQDKGHNAELTYTILSGNVGSVFSIDSMLGTVSVAKELDRNDKPHYELVVMAMDKGDHPMSNKATVIIDVTISDNAPPKFDSLEYMAELQENQPWFTNVYTMTANCRSSVIYTIVGGNEKGIFAINPNSGVVYTKKSVDYETDMAFNLTIKATSIIHSSTQTNLHIHIIDENDNAPEFIKEEYVGNVTESAKAGTIVLNATSEPLVILAKDKDSGLNAVLIYEIRDDYAKNYITIDPNTGAIRTVSEFDHEEMDKIEFSVEVWDMGKPQLRTKFPAKVILYINDVNDTPPKFTEDSYNAEVLLPTYKDVIVVTADAHDDDTGVDSKLKYSLVQGNDDRRFRIDEDTGAIFIVNESNMADKYKLKVQVTDGIFKTETIVFVAVSQPTSSPFTFTHEVYEAWVIENHEIFDTLTVVQVENRGLNQQFTYSLLNGGDKFEIGFTSGVVTTTGVAFDREEVSIYNLVVEVRGETPQGPQRAHALVKVMVEDENDNDPVFVHQPYHSVLVHDSVLGHVVKQVTAIDRDAGNFGQVTYSVKGRGDLDDRFAIDPKSGKISVFRPLTTADVGKEIVLSAVAADGGSPSRSSETTVKITVISKNYPVFDQQVYRATIPEHYPVGSSVASLTANSPTQDKLIYTIIEGDRYGDFDVDFNIAMDVHGPCLITVRGYIEYNSIQTYNLTVQAVEVKSGLATTAVVIVTVQDINNFAPVFKKELYEVTVSEAASIGASVVKVTATDPESGLNGLVHYSLITDKKGSREVDWFTVDSKTGLITTKKFLDRERQSEFSFLVEATDSGQLPLSSNAVVRVKISDLNDNAPIFDQASYHCVITDQGERGQLVTKVSATDPDTSSAGLLRYSIIGGNDQHTFQMDEDRGIIILSKQRKPQLYRAYELNISVTDGVFTNFARVSIKVQNSNVHSPRFEQSIYVAEFPENYGEGMLVTQVSAVDNDAGNYGMISYSIPSEEMLQYFRVDADSGEIFSVQVFDREHQSVFNVPIAATDNGGRMAFTKLHVSITDQNDNVPQFLAQEYKSSLLDSTPINSTIMKIQAEDADSGRNGKIMYSFGEGTVSRITQMFHIDPETGIIRTLQLLKDSVNEMFQFFVEASDQGSTPMKNSVPVNMWVTDNIDVQPVFTQSSYSFFLPENEAVSTVIATVRAVSILPLEYLIVPGFTKSSNAPARFGIDSKGRIHVAGSLDMESTSAYTLTVQAQTLSNRPLVRQTTVNIRLMDVNDNYPYFESNPYRVTVPENSESGISIIQVVAHDLDKSSKFRYSFGDNMRKYAHQFSIDSITGVVTLLSPLDREQQDMYNLTVWVKDSDAADALQNLTMVQVKVMDHNDNPPLFTRSYYQAAVNEDAYQGTILMTLTTVDKDIGPNTDTQYYIIQGDPEGKFKVRKNGDIFVNRPLDRETVPRYHLVVAATDGGFVSTATVTVDILDANDNSPVCEKLQYSEIVSEDVQTSWVILRLKATDADEYGSLHYELTEDHSEHFFLEPNSGALTAAIDLDRETMDLYHLVAKAVDSGRKSCTMDITIKLSDVNDNSPVFSPVQGPIPISEGAALNTLVYRVYASDADFGINRQVLYELKTNPDGMFTINEKSGLLQLAKELDRETTAAHTVTVVAKDRGKPQMTTEIELEINVLDINDNPPEFEQTTYWASVPENAVIGQSITSILATSKDTGINAKISYYIQAGNDKDKFSVDPDTGVIRTAGVLNHETVPGYVLTVRAQDHGEVPLSNTAYVQINVTDVNDNPPVFAQKLYTAKIREDAKIGSKVIQVISSDADSDPRNKAANYSILSGDQFRVFDIHPSDGTLVVRNHLDRETISAYALHIRAANYHLMAETIVNIEVLDANDSPPRFTEDNYTVFVQMNSLLSEDKDVTACVLKFEVTDDDLDPNGAPFTFDITSGDGEGKFHVDNEGNLCIARNLNRQVTADYQLIVRVYDNGTPAMYSEVKVEVSVIEESTFSPEVSNMAVSISSYLDEFPGGVIGVVKAIDGDQFDTLEYQVVSENRHLFDIDKLDGRLLAFAGLDSGNYMINVSVTDGKYTSYGSVDVEVTTITTEMIANAITLQLADVDAEKFVKNYKRDFQRVLKRELGVRTRDIEIINIQKSQGSIDAANRSRRDTSSNLDILFAVSRNGEYISRDRLKRKVARAIPELEDAMSVKILKVFSDVCEKDMCEGGECLGFVEFDKDSLVPILMDGGSFVAAKHRYTYECECPNGNIGDNCLSNPTSCDENPCPTYKLCTPHPVHGYQCLCPQGQTGRHCEKDLDNKCDNTNCPRVGDSPITFSGNSYAKWKLVDPIDRRLSLSMRIKTIKDTASLMFAKGRVDYSILELVNGMVQYRFDCGSGEGLVLLPNHVSDGKWHTIMVERHGKDAAIFLDGQFSSLTSAPGTNDVLNLDTSDVYFGAEVEMYANGYIDIRKGFRGCIEDIRIYNVRLPVSGNNAVALSQDFEKVEFSCRDSDFAINGNNICSTFPCMNGGQCETTGQNTFICRCSSDRYRGAKCEIDSQPCLRQPCLNNGVCENVVGIPNEFVCKCVGDYRGRRCEYGKFCLPNPCKHGGTCIEGPASFNCLCQAGFTGSRCESIVDVCLSNPCKNQGDCIQEGSGYVCNCSNSFSGSHCEDIIIPAISSSSAGINSDEIYAIAGVAGGLILVVIIFVLIRVWRQKKRQRRHANITPGIAGDGTEVYLNLLKDDKNKYKAENMLKMDKINNRNKSPPSPQPPPVPDRPASYTPSARDSINTLNNFDQLRSCTYGSAADELEHVPNIPPYNLDFLTFAPPRSVASIQPTIPPPPQSDTDSIQKEPWEFACQNILQNYMSEKNSDKLSKMMPIGTVQPMSHLQGQDNTSISSLPVSESEDDQQANRKKGKKGYHWDTSDWAPERSLPNISEVPAGECPDSPGSESPHSNESNTHIDNLGQGRYMTDGEYIDSEYVGDSEYAEHDMEEPPDLPNYEELLAEQSRLLDDYEMPNRNMHVHPDYYLPLNSSFTSADGPNEENWPAPPPCVVNGAEVNISDSSHTTTSSDDDNDSVLHYGFPPSHFNNINRLSMVTTDSDLNVDSNRLSAAYTTDSEANDGDFSRGSVIDDMSDISGLCEIEDSEVNNSDSEDENTPLNTQRIHTEV